MSKSIIESMKLTFHNKILLLWSSNRFYGFLSVSTSKYWKVLIYSGCENIDTEIIFGRRGSLNSDYSIAMVFLEITLPISFDKILYVNPSFLLKIDEWYRLVEEVISLLWTRNIEQPILLTQTLWGTEKIEYRLNLDESSHF